MNNVFLWFCNMYFSSLSMLASFLILLPMVAVCGVVTVSVKQQKPFTSQEIRKIGKDLNCDQYDDDDDDDDDYFDDNDDALCYIMLSEWTVCFLKQTNIFDGWDGGGWIENWCKSLTHRTWNTALSKSRPACNDPNKSGEEQIMRASHPAPLLNDQTWIIHLWNIHSGKRNFWKIHF